MVEKDEAARKTVRYAAKFCTTLLTEEMAKEVNVMSYLVSVRKGQNPLTALRATAKYLLGSERIRTSTQFSWCSDPGDAMFVECAIDGKADVVVSNDRSLTAIKEYVTDEHARALIHPIQFLTPEQFIQAFF